MARPDDRRPEAKARAEDEDAAATRAALAHYAATGSDLARPMTLDFYVVAPDEAIARVVQVRTVAMGFTSRVEYDEDAVAWDCVCTATIVPTFERVVALERLLGRLAREVGAHADGFASEGNASAR